MYLEILAKLREGHVCYYTITFWSGMLLIWLSTIFLWTDRRSSVSNHPLSASPCSVICIQCRQRQRQRQDRDTNDKEFARQRRKRKRHQDRDNKIKDKQIRKTHQLPAISRSREVLSQHFSLTVSATVYELGPCNMFITGRIQTLCSRFNCHSVHQKGKIGSKKVHHRPLSKKGLPRETTFPGLKLDVFVSFSVSCGDGSEFVNTVGHL